MTTMGNLLEDMAGLQYRRNSRPHVHPDAETIRLRDACALYHCGHVFKVGDLVCKKRGIHIASQENPGSEPVYIVMDIIPDAAPCTDVSTIQCYGIMYDLYVGYYDEDDDFSFMPTDSRRMEPWPRPE